MSNTTLEVGVVTTAKLNLLQYLNALSIVNHSEYLKAKRKTLNEHFLKFLLVNV